MIGNYVWLVIITDIKGLQTSPPRITGENEIHITVAGCEREKDYVIAYMKERGFEITAECKRYRIIP